MRTAAATAVLVGTVAALASPTEAATIRVNCANASLQARINAVAPGSTILVKGTCDSVVISKNLTLDGNPRATIDAGGVGRPVEISGSPRLRLIDLRVSGGFFSGSLAVGGGIVHPGGDLTLRRVAVVGNVVEATGGVATTALGGGIYSQGGALRLVNSSVRSNVARALGGSAGAGGGGIARTGNLVLENTRVANNRVRAESATTSANARGGGIVVGPNRLTLVDSHVNSNRSTAIGTGPATGANGGGGGIELTDTTNLKIVRSTVSENRAVASLAGGTAGAEGGGLHGFAQRGTIRNSVLDGNQARATSSGGANTNANGAGGYLEAPSGLTILRSRVTGSLVLATTGGTATGSGGGLALAEGPFSVRRSRIGGNEIEVTGGSGPSTARGAGLIGTATASIELEDSTVTANRARASGPGGSAATGGGVEIENATLRLRASTVSRNVASTAGQALGGGVRLASGGPHAITNSTIALNRATGATARGGGINTASNLTVTNATLARNTAKLGGGLYVENGTTTLAATLLGANTAPASADCGGPVGSSGRNLIAKTLGCMFTAQPSDRRDVQPKLGALGAHGGPTQTIPLRPGSPALDAIPRAGCAVGRDQRGVGRPQGRRCDIGAYERRR